MPRGDKSSYSSKQRRQAKHIEDSEKKGGRSSKAASRIAWATVNKQDGGAKSKSKSKTKSKSTSKKSKSSKSTSKKKSKSSKKKS